MVVLLFVLLLLGLSLLSEKLFSREYVGEDRWFFLFDGEGCRSTDTRVVLSLTCSQALRNQSKAPFRVERP
jgi:hypothetical protein